MIVGSTLGKMETTGGMVTAIADAGLMVVLIMSTGDSEGCDVVEASSTHLCSVDIDDDDDGADDDGAGDDEDDGGVVTFATKSSLTEQSFLPSVYLLLAL